VGALLHRLAIRYQRLINYLRIRERKLDRRRWWFSLPFGAFLAGMLATVADLLRVLTLLATLVEKYRQASRKSLSRLAMVMPRNLMNVVIRDKS